MGLKSSNHFWETILCQASNEHFTYINSDSPQNKCIGWMRHILQVRKLKARRLSLAINENNDNES